MTALLLSTFFFFSCVPEIETKDSEGPQAEQVVENVSLITWATCSQMIDDHPCNFTLRDRFDDEVSLYDFIGSPIVLDLSTMWCAPCNIAADEVQEVQDSYSDDDLVYMTVLIENYNGEPPSVEDCRDWGEDHDIATAPILAGDRSLLSSNPVVGWPLTGWPTFYFIDAGMITRSVVRGFNAQLVEIEIEKIIAQN